MKNRIKNVTVLFLCVVIGLTASTAFAGKNACGKEMTAEEMAERALDVQEIQNVMAMHQLYGVPGGDHNKEIELIWTHKTPGVSFAGNNYIVQGDIEVIKKFYGSGGHMQQPTGGNTSFRSLTTPIIEVAGDGKTAKGFWYTPGWQADIRDGKGNSIWTYEKYAIDFVKEDGKWKIWHFHVYNDWDVPMGEDLAQYAIEKAKNTGEMPARQVQEEIASYYKAVDFNESYSPTRPPNPLKPRPPEPYCTFSETFSYAEE